MHFRIFGLLFLGIILIYNLLVRFLFFWATVETNEYGDYEKYQSNKHFFSKFFDLNQFPFWELCLYLHFLLLFLVIEVWLL